MHTGLVGVAEFDEKPLGLERDEFGHARLDRPDRYFVHPPGEPFTLVGKDSGDKPMANSRRGLEAGLAGLKAAERIATMLGLHDAKKIRGRLVLRLLLP